MACCILSGFLIGLVCLVWMHQRVPKQDGLAIVQKKFVTYFAVASSMLANSCFDVNWVDQKSFLILL